MQSNSSTMEMLFDALAEEFKNQLTEGKKKINSEGELVSESPDAATLNAVRQFLKDNNISIKPGSDNNILNELVDQLPRFEDIPVTN